MKSTILIPTAVIKIQKAGIVPPSGKAKFFELPIADQSKKTIGLVSSCDVIFSSTSTSSSVTATFQVANLHPNTVRAMAEAGYVKIEAGYVGHPSRPVQIIFFGRMDTVKYRLSSGKIMWTFTALAFPNEIWAIKPHATQPLDNSGAPQRITIGEAIRIIADRIGIGRANTFLPKLFDGDLTETPIVAREDLAAKATETFTNAIMLDTWTTTGTAIEELQYLLQRVSLVIQESFGVIRNYTLLPDVNNPFRIIVDDTSLFTGEFLNLDLDSPQILDAGPAQATATTPATDPVADAADSSGDAEPAAVPVAVREYEFSSVFDPKISMGVLIRGKSKKLGLAVAAKVTKGKHSLNGTPLRWRTECTGNLQEDVAVARSS